MKRFLILATAWMVLSGLWAFAAEKASVPSPKPTAAASQAGKMTKMRAPGTILEITDSTLIIERVVKDKVEKMTFVLETPMKFKVGDKVRVSYVEADGRMVATRIVRLSDLQGKKPAKTGPELKPAVKGAAPTVK